LELNEYIGFILNNATRKYSQLAVNFFKQYDVTPEQAGIIRRLGEQEGITQKDLSIRMCKDQTNITRILGQLERKGLILRNQSEDDKRAFLIYLTDNGKKINKNIIPTEQEIMNIILKGISEERIALLKDVINELVGNIDNYNKK
jgi:DNA-binding MarR family transcriptional regulator